MSIREDADKYFNAYSFTEPYVDPNAAFVGKKLSFEGTDLNGNAVKSEDLFKDNKVTMVNFWATSCHGCIDEMPKLEALNKELAAQAIQISTFPTTFFVSSDGTVLTLPVVSADFGAYSTGLEAALALV